MMDKITMIGVSGAGKTCFIYAMYNFMSMTNNGFAFTAADMDKDQDLQDGWRAIVDDHKWPHPTAGTTDYDFFVQYNTYPILQFSWCDYRGGATNDRSTEQDKKELIQRIYDSSCLIISIGADTIKEIIGGNQSKTRELSILNGIIRNYELSHTERKIPVIIALTKADLYTKEERGKLIGLIQQYFHNLFLPKSGWLTAIVPITLGLFPTGNATGEITGTIEPKNIHVPVMFFVSVVLCKKVKTIKKNLLEREKRRKQYQKDADDAKNQGWFSKIWNGDGVAIANTNISNLDNEERNLLERLNEIKDTLGSMKDLFRVCKIYYEGTIISWENYIDDIII